MKIVVVIGARPQFIKHAPLEIASRGIIDIVTIHTGQHYDQNMSQVFFDELKMKHPDYMLNAGGGNHGEQTGKMLQLLEPILIDEKPDYLLVYGDTNSTIAGALAAAKLHIPVVHIEAGLRSYNKDMPEEVNRILTDHLSSLLFTSTANAVANLDKEGISKGVFLLGDIMADSVMLAQEINKNRKSPFLYPYYFVTIHRPYNTDYPKRLLDLIEILNNLDERVVFPIHPRTRNLCKEFQIDLNLFTNINFCEPLSYFDNINYLSNAKHAITDSGGLQKEAYILKVPCVTVRSETEWIETLKGNWNILCFNSLTEIPDLLERELGEYTRDLYGNGNASGQIIDVLLNMKKRTDDN